MQKDRREGVLTLVQREDPEVAVRLTVAVKPPEDRIDAGLAQRDGFWEGKVEHRSDPKGVHPTLVRHGRRLRRWPGHREARGGRGG